MRGRPVNVAAEETRARVVLAARDVFAARGYAGASMRHIAAGAGVTAMAIYNYAPSKAALFELVWQESVAALYAGFSDAIVGAASLAAEVDAMFDYLFAAINDDPVGPQFSSRLLVERSHPDLAHIDLHVGPYAEFFIDMTQRAIRRGELRRRDSATFVSFVSTLLWGFISVATLDRASLGISVAAAKAAVARFLAS